ncbi:glycoside hydrolase family 2 protein [Hamadaea tsunoensis]|uniref:glycoside hydrolase family 2 protein n=1 Tax=Hamadaea tsunoensis TaxID=53368 RepID=UPI0003FD154F|nr:glycoside hydrolase family 2 protein [Hamadaea tsunoensis]
MSSVRNLHDGWTLAVQPGAAAPEFLTGRSVAATVPGCVHTDLLASGLIPDPYLDDNETRLGWIGRSAWTYTTAFEWSPDADRVDLLCAGLDTVATVTLNGHELGRTANMHRSYRFEVRDLLRPGRNELSVHFDSAYAYAQEQQARLGDRPNAYPEPFNFIRKMACNFGWDWGPTLVTAGIWQPISLHSWNTARLAEVRPNVALDGTDGVVDVSYELERLDGVPLNVVVEIAGVTVVGEVTADSGTVRVRVPAPDRWWPRDLGDQPLYALTVTLRAGDAELDRWERKVGFRDLVVDRTDDGFALVVNGRPTFARGVNWIPDDAFVTRVSRERLATRLRQAVGANVNFVRVWGGGRYESADFYELCDELGLLVMQDFLFACAAYPEEEPFRSEVAAEAREQVVRLAPHPSLALWAGNNENIWGHEDWDWKEPLAGKTWGAGFYFDLLPSIVADADPGRFYWPGSPWSGDRDRHPNLAEAGTMHIWDVWNQLDYTHYRDHRPRFVAEFGYQAPPAYATLTRALHDRPLAPDSPGMAHHQKAADGDLKLRRGLDAHLPVPADFDDWLYYTQLNQARAIQLGVEYFRSLRPYCMGAVVWQLNDCWPVTSWSAVDGDGRRKPLWYALRRAFADRLLTVQPGPEGLSVFAVNDGASAWDTSVTIARRSFDGKVLATAELPVALAAGSSTRFTLPAELSTPDEVTAECVVVSAAGAERAWWFFAEDRDVDYAPASYEAVVVGDPGTWKVMVTARTFLRDLALFADRLDPSAEVDEQLVSLFPGETATFTVTGGALEPSDLLTAPVLRTVN